MFNIKNIKGGIHVVWGERTSLTLHPLLWVPYHKYQRDIGLNQLTFILIKGQFNVWHIRPYHDTISHIIEQLVTLMSYNKNKNKNLKNNFQL